MRIRSYYVDVPDLVRYDELRLVTRWRAAWEAEGWEPFVMNEWHARQHAYYPEFKQAIAKLPTCNPVRYEEACYLRWLALAADGGGWMADYDLFPRPGKSFPITLTGAEMNRLIVFQRPCCPCLVYCTAANAERFCEVIAEGLLGNRPQGDRPHASDQYMLEDLLTAGADWVQARDVVKLWSDVGYETAPAVHFASAPMARGGKLPKYKHVSELLK